MSSVVRMSPVRRSGEFQKHATDLAFSSLFCCQSPFKPVCWGQQKNMTERLFFGVSCQAFSSAPVRTPTTLQEDDSKLSPTADLKYLFMEGILTIIKNNMFVGKPVAPHNPDRNWGKVAAAIGNALTGTGSSQETLLKKKKGSLISQIVHVHAYLSAKWGEQAQSFPEVIVS